MPKKLLVVRLGVGTLTVALCATLPGCNLGGKAFPGCAEEPSACPVDANHVDGASDTARSSADSASDVGGQ